VKFNPASLPGPRLTDLPPERYYELRKLHRTIERQQDTPERLLQDLTRQLPVALLDQLQAIVRGDGDYQDDELGPVRAALVACGSMCFEANVTEDSFLAMAWLEVADQALEHMEASWLLMLTAV
jgi:hypothetical protein